MNKLRLVLLIVAAATFAGATSPAPAFEGSASTERIVRTAAPRDGTRSTHVSIEAVVSDAIAGSAGSLPAHGTTSQACITVDPAGTDQATQTYCGPAQVDVSPTLGTATASGVIRGIEFSLQFTATDGVPTAAVDEIGPTGATLSAARTGTAFVTLVGELVGDAETLGSSWYADVKEKAKTSSSGS